MIETQDISEIRSLSKPLHLAMGVFDGVHVGHREVIEQVVKAAKENGGLAGVLTFDPFPLQVIAPDRAPQKILASLAHKKALLEEMGVDLLLVIPFSMEFAKLSAEEFLDLLHGEGSLAQISVGEDWKFGKGREGKLDFLQHYCTARQIQLTATAPIMLEGERISSTRIRQAIRDGNLSSAQKMLGRNYSLYGQVEKGDQIGRTIGFPTANVNTRNELLPPDGVYAVKVKLGEELINGVANLGVRPTVTGENQRKFEVHLFDFDREIYGQELMVMLGQFIRGEQKFEGLDELKAQITADCAVAREAAQNVEIW